MNSAEVEEFKQFKAWREIQGKYGYDSPWSTELNNVKLGFKNRKVQFSNKVENTQSV